MGTREKIPVMLAVMVMCLGGLDAYYYYGTYDLNYYCGKVISLPCGHTASYRGGTLKFTSYPTRTCTVNVTVDNSNCYSSYENYAIYYNVKELSLSYGDTVVVRENSTYYPYTPTVMKTYSGQPTPSYSPTSHDQFMTKTSPAPAFSITFTSVNTSPSFTTKALTLDYNVVHGSPNAATDSYCSALSGYVQDELICELSDRVNCPTSYTAYTNMNPVYSKNQGSQEVCPSSYSSSTTSPYVYRPLYPSYTISPYLYGPSYSSYTISPYVYRPSYPSSYSYYDDTGVIVGAVFGSIAGFMLIVSLISLACRNRTHRVVHRHTAGVSVPVYNQNSACGPNVVISSYPTAGCTAQPPTFNGTFAGPPPSYEHIGPPPAGPAPGPAGAYIMPEPPKF